MSLVSKHFCRRNSIVKLEKEDRLFDDPCLLQKLARIVVLLFDFNDMKIVSVEQLSCNQNMTDLQTEYKGTGKLYQYNVVFLIDNNTSL